MKANKEIHGRKSATPRLPPAMGALVLGAIAIAGWWYWSNDSSHLSQAPSGMTCDMGISAAKTTRGAAVSVTASTARTTDEIPHTPSQTPPGPAPQGMVWIAGGEFWMGADEFPDAQPWHRVNVNGFWMDKTEVTNEQF